MVTDDILPFKTFAFNLANFPDVAPTPITSNVGAEEYPLPSLEIMIFDIFPSLTIALNSAPFPLSISTVGVSK